MSNTRNNFLVTWGASLRWQSPFGKLFSFCKIALIVKRLKPRQAFLMCIIFKKVFWKHTKRHVINHRSLQRKNTLVSTSLDQAPAKFQDGLIGFRRRQRGGAALRLHTLHCINDGYVPLWKRNNATTTPCQQKTESSRTPSYMWGIMVGRSMGRTHHNKTLWTPTYCPTASNS